MEVNDEHIIVYILYSKSFERYYVGMTNNFSRRFKQHNSSYVKSTKYFVPWEVVFKESFNTRSEARKREKYLKSAAGRKWRKNNLIH